jgi:arabinogalactan endo-1,4-beta-galactosidase
MKNSPVKEHVCSLLSLNKNIPMFILFVSSLLQPPEIRPQFANGADIGFLSEMEAQGYRFYDDSGKQKDCLDILREHGINALRFRVWVNPTQRYCSKKDVAAMAHRADSMGFRVMLNFHFSDTWADPGKQTKPAAWASHTVPQLIADIHDQVYDVLDTLKTLGVIPAWVQIGNETNNGMLWEDGRASTHMTQFAAMINSGYDAVKAVDSTIQVIVHLSNGHDLGMYRWMFDGLKNNGAKWDIIGMSVYPYWAKLTWATDNEMSLATMKEMIVRYQKKIIVCETGYLCNEPATAYHFLVDLIRKTKSVNGLGVFYWEPEKYDKNNPGSGYPLGAWDPFTKKPTVAMDAFLDTAVDTNDCNETVSDYDLNVYPNPFNPKTTVEYKLPTSSNVSIVIRNVIGKEVLRLVDGYESAGCHKVIWSADAVSSGVYFCRMKSGNFIKTQKILYLR